MAKRSNKIPVKEDIMTKAMDRVPIKGIGDAWARNLSEKKMLEYASREGMADVYRNIMSKAVLKDVKGNEIQPSDMADGTPYVIARNDKNIGWIMRKGAACAGRIYNSEIDTYEDMKNDPDRPYVYDGIEFEGTDEDFEESFDDNSPTSYGQMIGPEIPESVDENDIESFSYNSDTGLSRDLPDIDESVDSENLDDTLPFK